MPFLPGCAAFAKCICHFCQVVPRERLQPWIAGRQSAACGLLGDGTLVTLGGFGPGGTAPNKTLASFTWTPGAALEFHAGIVKQGRHLSLQLAP